MDSELPRVRYGTMMHFWELPAQLIAMPDENEFRFHDITEEGRIAEYHCTCSEDCGVRFYIAVSPVPRELAVSAGL
jgi:hypothetical protein